MIAKQSPLKKENGQNGHFRGWYNSGDHIVAEYQPNGDQSFATASPNRRRRASTKRRALHKSLRIRVFQKSSQQKLSGGAEGFASAGRFALKERGES